MLVSVEEAQIMDFMVQFFTQDSDSHVSYIVILFPILLSCNGSVIGPVSCILALIQSSPVIYTQEASSTRNTVVLKIR